MDVTPVSPGCLAGIFSNGATVLLPCFCSALTGPICMTVVAVSRWKGDFQNIGIAREEREMDSNYWSCHGETPLRCISSHLI